MEHRPDPDVLLAELNQSSPRGLLKVFLGYAAGVGKSYAMLQAANAALLQGRDVVIGWIEPHPRVDTLLLLAGMRAVEAKEVQTGTMVVSEMDLDACLVRRPEVLLVDELAHSNAPGSRHLKRWQDVEELLTAGIEVWTTVNIQHLDSMNDVVARVTGVQVHETVPDRIFDSAQEVEIVDVDPEDLMDRLRQGKVYKEPQARRALESFFRKENLLALRELTFRRAADRVGKEVDSARAQKRVQTIWPVRERLMVSVGPSPLSEDLLRQAARMARSLDAELLAVSIETPAHRIQDTAAQARLAKNLAVAETLGAETVVLQGEEVARDLVAYARKRNVTKLVIGKNRDQGWRRLAKRTIGDELLRLSGDIDVYVLSGRRTTEPPNRPKARGVPLGWGEIAGTALLVLGFTTLAMFFRSWGLLEGNIVLTLLMSVVVAAALFGLGASIFASFLTVLAFNFFFTQPLYSLNVADPQYYLVFLFLLIVGAVIGTLTQRLRSGIVESRKREQRMETLNRMHRELAGLVDSAAVRATSEQLIREILGGPVSIIQKDDQGVWSTSQPPTPSDVALYDWAWNHGQRAGKGTGTLFDHRLSVWPLVGSRNLLGLLVLEEAGAPDLVESLASLVASALERVALIDETRHRDLQVETERTRNALLHSLSHDLRTPLTIMGGSLETLAHSRTTPWSDGDRALLASVRKETLGLGRQVENLLELSRLTEGGLSWTLGEVPIEEPLESAVDRFQNLHPEAVLTRSGPEGVPTATMESRLVFQALSNFLENAWEYSENQSIDTAVQIHGETVRYEVRDRGPGVEAADRPRIFEKFARGRSQAGGHRGSGLGLAIVAEVARLHRGRAGVEDRPGGGSIFFLEFPRGPS